MNQFVKYGIIFLTGIAVGMASAIKFLDKKYEDKFNKDLEEELKKNQLFFKEDRNTMDEGVPVEKLKDGEEISDPAETEKTKYVVMSGKYTAPDRIDYHALSRKKTAESDIKKKVEKEPETPKRDTQNIIVTDRAAWVAVNGKERVEVTYYEGDNVYVDDQTGEEMDPHTTCGTEVVKHFSEEIPDVAYSVNYDFGVIYQVYCCHGEYGSID